MLIFLQNVISAFIGAGIVTAIFSYWFEERRRKEIKKEEAVEAITEFLAEWVKSSYVSNADENEARWKLQSMYWKTILRLDKKILDVLIPRLANKEGAVPTNEIIIEVRKALLNLKESDLKVSDLNNWLPKK